MKLKPFVFVFLLLGCEDKRLTEAFKKAKEHGKEYNACFTVDKSILSPEIEGRYCLRYMGTGKDKSAWKNTEIKP